MKKLQPLSNDLNYYALLALKLPIIVEIESLVTLYPTRKNSFIFLEHVFKYLDIAGMNFSDFELSLFKYHNKRFKWQPAELRHFCLKIANLFKDRILSIYISTAVKSAYTLVPIGTIQISSYNVLAPDKFIKPNAFDDQVAKDIAQHIERLLK